MSNLRGNNRTPGPRPPRRMGDAEVEISGTIEHETAKAWLFNDGVRKIWMPKSQCTWDEAEKLLTVPEWLAYEKELI